MFRLCDFVSLKRFGMEVSPMPATRDERVQVNSSGPVRNVVRYGLHLLAVYAIVQFGTMWLAGQMHGTILPLLQQHPPSDSVFQFAFTHLFAFSFLPALIVRIALLRMVSAPRGNFRLDSSGRSSWLQVRNTSHEHFSKSLRCGRSRIFW
jgi:hypothetical protein